MTVIKIILIPLLVGIIAHFIKLIPEALKGNFNIRHLLNLTYGGMPSGHAALLASLSTMVAIEEGINSAIFALSAVLSIIILRDSIGLRHILDIQNKLINKIAKQIFPEKEKIPILGERLEHSFLEVVIGVLLGVGLTLLLNWWFF